MNDLRAVMWKEWRELLAQSDFSRSATIALAIPLLLIVVAIAALSGPTLLLLPLPAILCTFMAIIGVIPGVCEAFAGERERHTLETLLATRATTEALLVGKILVQVLYSWGVGLLLYALFIVGANLRASPTGYVWPSAMSTLQIVIILPLLLGLIVMAGGIFSLRAATVRQAQARLIASVMFAFVGLVILIKSTSISPRIEAVQEFVHSPREQLIAAIVAGAVLAAANVAMFFVAWARFQRHRLIEIR